MPILYAQKLIGLLEEQGSSAEISTTEERKEAIREENKKHVFPGYPVFSGGHDFVYIEIKNEDLLIVKSELEKMGHPLQVSDVEGDFRPEYLCPKCDYKLDEKSICPKHRVPLLEYSEWLVEKNKPGAGSWLWSVFVITMLLCIGYLYSGSKFFSKLPFMP